MNCCVASRFDYIYKKNSLLKYRELKKYKRNQIILFWWGAGGGGAGIWMVGIGERCCCWRVLSKFLLDNSSFSAPPLLTIIAQSLIKMCFEDGFAVLSPVSTILLKYVSTSYNSTIY